MRQPSCPKAWTTRWRLRIPSDAASAGSSRRRTTPVHAFGQEGCLIAYADLIGELTGMRPAVTAPESGVDEALSVLDALDSLDTYDSLDSHDASDELEPEHRRTDASGAPVARPGRDPS